MFGSDDGYDESDTYYYRDSSEENGTMDPSMHEDVAYDSLGEEVEEFMEPSVEATETVIEYTEEVIEEVGAYVEEGVQDVGTGVSDVIEGAGTLLEDTSEETGVFLEEGIEDMKDAVVSPPEVLEEVPQQPEIFSVIGSDGAGVIHEGDRIYFALNSSDLSSEAKDTLNRQADWILDHPDYKVLIEGHCDERGTRDYNLALAERRALSVKNYLHSRDVASNQITVVSYGKSRPSVIGFGNEEHAKNRRAVTLIVRE